MLPVVPDRREPNIALGRPEPPLATDEAEIIIISYDDNIIILYDRSGSQHHHLIQP